MSEETGPADIRREWINARPTKPAEWMRTEHHEMVFRFLEEELRGEPEGEEAGLLSDQAVKMIRRLKRENAELRKGRDE